MNLPLWAVPGSPVICVNRGRWLSGPRALLSWILAERHPAYLEECQVIGAQVRHGATYLKLRGFTGWTYRVDLFRAKPGHTDGDVETRLYRGKRPTSISDRVRS